MKKIFICVISVLIFSMVISAITEEGSLYEKLILEKGILGKGIVEKFFVDLTKTLKLLFEHNIKSLIEKNPNVLHSSVQGAMTYLIIILEPLCILALLISSLYFIVLSGTPWERATAKSMIPGLIIAIVLIPFSSYILFTLFSISENLTHEIFALSSGDSTKAFTGSADYLLGKISFFNEISTMAFLPFVFLIALTLFLPLLLFAVRYILLVFFSVVFPLTVFLYLFLPTRFFGKRLLEFTISWLFVQIIAAVALVAVSGLLLTLDNIPYELKIFTEIAATLSLVAVTLGMIATVKDYLPE